MEKKCVLQHVYYDLFNHQRNIGFFQPKKDQCTLCVGWINKTTEEKEVSREEYDAHILAKEQCREEKSKDSAKGREGIIKVCCYDLQAVLQTPCGDVNMFYYKRKLGVYNFTIYEISSRDGYCFVWNEEQANRGAIEMASCLWKYLNEANSIDIPIIFYSDNCAGQNKNKFIATLYMYATMKLNIPSITHKFLLCGHSQNEGDAMHACIEKEKKRCLKSGPIYVPEQWIPIISLARKGEPYKVNQMGTEDMLDFKKLCSEIGNNFTVNNDNEKVMWGKIKVLEARKDSPYKLFYKNKFCEKEFKTITVRKVATRGRRPRALGDDLNLQQAYSKPPGITSLKKKI